MFIFFLSTALLKSKEISKKMQGTWEFFDMRRYKRKTLKKEKEKRKIRKVKQQQ